MERHIKNQPQIKEIAGRNDDMDEKNKQTERIVLTPTGRITADNVGQIEQDFLKIIGEREAPELVKSPMPGFACS